MEPHDAVPRQDNDDDSDDADTRLAGQVTAGGDAGRHAERMLYARFAPRVRAYGRRHLRDTQAVEDLTQDVMLRTVEALRAARVDDPSRLGAFILGTCRYMVWDLRRETRRARHAATSSEPAVAWPSENGPDHRRLHGCLRQLSQREATIVMMTFQEDCSAEEIGAALALACGNVRVIRHRALAKLHACVTGEGGGS